MEELIMFHLLIIFFLIINFVYDIFITIKLPKSKKYNNKSQYIYRLVEYDFQYHLIERYELKYQFLGFNNLFLLYFILPIPIRFSKYKYWKSPNTYFVDKYKAMSQEFHIGLEYEIQYLEYIHKIQKELEENEYIERHNKEFNQNF